MRSMRSFLGAGVLLGAAVSGAGEMPVDLNGTFDLGSAPVQKPRYYEAETRIFQFGPGGRRNLQATTRLHLQVGWKGEGAQAPRHYTCGRFAMSYGKAKQESTIPALAGWSYQLDDSDPAVVFGIPHDRFKGLVDDAQRPIGPMEAMNVWCGFIDFHAALDSLLKDGAKALRRVGDHATVERGQKAPLDFEGVLPKGAVFHIGDLAFHFDGIGRGENGPCALIRFDAGDSTIKIPTGEKSSLSAGHSRYRGAIWVDLATRWMERCDWEEVVLFDNPAGGGDKMVIWREAAIRSLTREAYEKEAGRAEPGR